MDRRIVGLVLACFCVGQLTMQAQDFKLFDRDVQIHGFASQGFVYTNTNNWLTMNSTQGSAGFTDFGVNASTNITDRLRVGAQFYDRNLGQLGQYHPSLDWAVADYRFRSWFGVRGGKAKTTLGLYTDSQDLDFLHTFVLLRHMPGTAVTASIAAIPTFCPNSELASRVLVGCSMVPISAGALQLRVC